jgi:hypothetical protein
MAWCLCGYTPFTRLPSIKLHREEYMREQQLQKGKPVPYSKRELKDLFPAEEQRHVSASLSQLRCLVAGGHGP